MANIHSQKKRNQRTARERQENRRRVSRVKTSFRRLRDALHDGDAERADAEHAELVRAIDKAVKSGALHPNNGARKKSRAARLGSASWALWPPSLGPGVRRAQHGFTPASRARTDGCAYARARSARFSSDFCATSR